MAYLSTDTSVDVGPPAGQPAQLTSSVPPAESSEMPRQVLLTEQHNRSEVNPTGIVGFGAKRMAQGPDLAVETTRTGTLGQMSAGSFRQQQLQHHLPSITASGAEIAQAYRSPSAPVLSAGALSDVAQDTTAVLPSAAAETSCSGQGAATIAGPAPAATAGATPNRDPFAAAAAGDNATVIYNTLTLETAASGSAPPISGSEFPAAGQGYSRPISGAGSPLASAGHQDSMPAPGSDGGEADLAQFPGQEEQEMQQQQEQQQQHAAVARQLEGLQHHQRKQQHMYQAPHAAAVAHEAAVAGAPNAGEAAQQQQQRPQQQQQQEGQGWNAGLDLLGEAAAGMLPHAISGEHAAMAAAAAATSSAMPMKDSSDARHAFSYNDEYQLHQQQHWNLRHAVPSSDGISYSTGCGGGGGGGGGSRAGRATPSPVYHTGNMCQVPGCTTSLAGSGVSSYFKRHRVCLAHAKADNVVINGATMRFCQQCGIMHPLTDFDGSRKSCRVQLDRHNLRRRCRRKTQLEKNKAAAAAAAAAIAAEARSNSRNGNFSNSRGNGGASSASPGMDGIGSSDPLMRGSTGHGKPARAAARAAAAAFAAAAADSSSEATGGSSRDPAELDGYWNGDAQCMGNSGVGYGGSRGSGYGAAGAVVHAAGEFDPALMASLPHNTDFYHHTIQQQQWQQQDCQQQQQQQHMRASGSYTRGAWDELAENSAAAAAVATASAAAAAVAKAALLYPASCGVQLKGEAGAGQQQETGQYFRFNHTQQQPQQQQQAVQWSEDGSKQQYQSGYTAAGVTAALQHKGAEDESHVADGGSGSMPGNISLRQLRYLIASAIDGGKGPGMTAIRDLGFMKQLQVVDELTSGIMAEIEVSRKASVATKQQQQQKQRGSDMNNGDVSRAAAMAPQILSLLQQLSQSGQSGPAAPGCGAAAPGEVLGAKRQSSEQQQQQGGKRQRVEPAPGRQQAGWQSSAAATAAAAAVSANGTPDSNNIDSNSILQQLLQGPASAALSNNSKQQQQQHQPKQRQMYDDQGAAFAAATALLSAAGIKLDSAAKATDAGGSIGSKACSSLAGALQLHMNGHRDSASGNHNGNVAYNQSPKGVSHDGGAGQQPQAAMLQAVLLQSLGAPHAATAASAAPPAAAAAATAFSWPGQNGSSGGGGNGGTAAVTGDAAMLITSLLQQLAGNN